MKFLVFYSDGRGPRHEITTDAPDHRTAAQQLFQQRPVSTDRRINVEAQDLRDYSIEQFQTSEFMGEGRSAPLQSKSFGSTVDYAQNIQQLPEDKVLRAILLDKAITGAIGSLLIWGTINLGAWYLFREDMNSTFSKINAPAGTFDVFIYGGAVIGACMLIFGVIGALLRSSIVGWLDGISLLVVGGWNIIHDFLLAGAVKSYGYTIKEQPSTIWIMVGIGQLIWGGKQLSRFLSLGAKPSGIDSSVKAAVRAKLIETLKAPSSPQTGRLTLSITRTQSFPFATEKTERFAMWLLPDRAYCLEKSLDWFFEIERAPLKGRQFKEQIVEVLDKGGSNRKLALEPSSLEAFNEWLRVE